MGETVSVMPAPRQELCHEQPALSCDGDAHWDAHLTMRRGKLNGGNRRAPPRPQKRLPFPPRGLARPPPKRRVPKPPMPFHLRTKRSRGRPPPPRHISPPPPHNP